MSQLHRLWRRLVSGNSQYVNQSNLGTAKIAVLPRCVYQHKQKQLNEATNKEILQLVDIERQLHAEHSVLVWDKQQSSGRIYLNLYIIERSWLSEHCSKAWILLPECWLIAKQQAKNSVLHVEDVFFARNEFGGKAVYKTPLMPTPELFAEASGINPSSIVRSDKRLEEATGEALSALMPKHLKHFTNPLLADKLKQYDYRPAFVSSIAIILVYLAASSLYFYLKLAQVNDRIAVLQPKTNETLTKAQSTQTAISAIEVYQQLFNERRFTLPIWLALAPVYEEKGRFIFVRYLLDGSFSIGLESDSASRTIKSLSQSEWVESVSLAGDVQSIKQKERYELTLRLKDSVK